MQAVVYENINLTELGKQFGQAAPARTSYVGPSVAVTVTDSDTDLFLPNFFPRRKVNAPKMTASVALKRFQDEARGEAVRDAGFNHMSRLQVTNQAPHRAYQSSVAIVPGLEAGRAGPNPFRLQLSDYFGP